MQNETFEPSGLKIIAAYSDQSTKFITYPATGLSVSQPSTKTTGKKNVTVSYTDNAVTKSTTFEITVEEEGEVTFTTESDKWGWNTYRVKVITRILKENDSSESDTQEIVTMNISEDGTYTFSKENFLNALKIKSITKIQKHYYDTEDTEFTSEYTSLASTIYTARINTASLSEIKMKPNGTIDLDVLCETYNKIPALIEQEAKEKTLEALAELGITGENIAAQIETTYDNGTNTETLALNITTADYSNATINVKPSMFETIGEDFNHYTTSKLDEFISETNIKSLENQTKTEELIPGIDIQYHLLYNINLPQKALKFNSNVKNVVFDLNNEEVKMSFLYKGGIVSDNLSLKNTANATLTGSLYTDQMNNDVFKAILNENFSTNNLPTITAGLDDENIENIYGTRVDEILKKYYTSSNGDKVTNFTIFGFVFDAKEALNGSSMFAENNNGGVSSNSNAYHLDVNAFMHMLNKSNKIGNVLIDGQNYFGNSLDRDGGRIANVVFGQDYHDIDISNLSLRGIIMSGENGRLPAISSAPYARIVLSNNDTYVPGIHAVDFSNLSLAKTKELEPQARVETFFNPTHKNDISISPTNGSVIYYFGNNYKTNYEADKDTLIFKASISTYEEIGNELINSTGKDVDTLLMQDKASYFENATRIQ